MPSESNSHPARAMCDLIDGDAVKDQIPPKIPGQNRDEHNDRREDIHLAMPAFGNKGWRACSSPCGGEGITAEMASPRFKGKAYNATFLMSLVS
ncbi:MAG: hypothetical protein FJY85_25400 [Deltaproteobacteria bacterium]|nr:hypothetical protein [Deltaproteobacteria bacterium]